MLARFLSGPATSSQQVFRVTVINGPRQSGKTTLLNSLVGISGRYVTLDDDQTLEYALSDPADFVNGDSWPLAIDEVQRGGDRLVLAIKAAADRDTRKGHFLLAGSTRFLTVPHLSESLAGRAEILDLWPLSQGELTGIQESFIDIAFSDPTAFLGAQPEQLSRVELFSRVVSGGYPEMIDQSPATTRRWFRNYLRTVIERDIVEASAIRQADELPRLLRLLAANTAGELVPSRMAGDLHLGDDVVRRYLGLLEMVGLLVRTPAWLPSLTAREKRHSKATLVDTGLTAAILGLNHEVLAAAGAQMAGPFLESFVTMEIRKQLSWSDTGVQLRHWRDRSGAEVDLVMEAPDGRIVAVEVKAGTSVTAADTRHLSALRDRLGERFVAGIVLTTGQRPERFGDRIWALPVSALWA